jgi:bla regulator protein blaR1
MIANLWLVSLLRASIEGGVLLLIVWALTRAWPRMPAAARCGLWWLGSLRMIAGLLPIPTVRVPWTFASVPAPAAHWPKVLPAPVLELGNAMAGAVAPAATTVNVAAPHAFRIDVISIVAAALWLAGVVVAAVITLRRIAAMRRVWQNAEPFEDARIARWRNEWAVVLGQGRVPEVRASADAHAPVAIGALRPGLLLPLDSTQLSDDALRVVLAHEMSHVRRGDLLFAWVPAVAQMLFWFHPLVRFAGREYLAAREEVCDADALRATGVSPRDYGALLVDYGVVRTSAVPGAACCGSRASRDLKRRLEMLSRTVRLSIAHRAGAIAVTLAVLVLGFAPIRFVSAAADDDKATEEYKHAVEMERKAELDRKREYDKVIQKNEGDPRKKEEMIRYKAANEAYKNASEFKSFNRPQTAYAIKVQGRKGTRGAVGMVDMEPLEAIDRNDETVVYFRFGDEMWLSKDPETIQRVMRALEPEDKVEVDGRGLDERIQALEERERQFEQQAQSLRARREDLEVRRDDLRRQFAKAERAGASTRELRTHLVELETLNDQLTAQEEQMARERAVLERERDIRGQMDTSRFAERDRIHQQVMDEIERIGRQAIREGAATRYIP